MNRKPISAQAFADSLTPAQAKNSSTRTPNMRHIEQIVRLMKSSGFPRGFVDTNYMTTNEQEAFHAACDREDVRTNLQLRIDREARSAAQ